MARRLIDRSKARAFGAVLAALALAFQLLMPPGFMPGSSLAQPIMLCDGQGPMPPMAMPGMTKGDHPTPGKMPHGMGDHSCPFAAAAATPVTPDLAGADLSPPVMVAVALADRPLRVAPGRGLAAPPPPSHAPPTLHA